MKQRKPAPKILIAIALGPICAAAADLPARDSIAQPKTAPVPVVQKGAPREVESRYSAEAMALAAKPVQAVRRSGTTSSQAAVSQAITPAGFDREAGLPGWVAPDDCRSQFLPEPASQGP